MLPTELKADQFAGYPPDARKLIVVHLGVLRQLPISFVPNLLREAIDYDFKFPAERAALDGELAVISALTPAQRKEWFQGFEEISLSAKLLDFDWVDQPAQFVEQQAAYLWTTGQLDGFRKAATGYGNRLQDAAPPAPLPVRRLGIAIIGQGVESYGAPLFRNLREHGTYFGRVKPENGLQLLLEVASSRAKVNPVNYGHWYVDGGAAADHDRLLTSVSYAGLEPIRAALLKKMNAEIAQPGMGPEELRTRMAKVSPQELGMSAAGDAVLDRFQVRLFTEGSGTQIFSTTFAQWTTREVLRRAQPLTLLVRFAPRQRQRPMNELLSDSREGADLDFVGSLRDADMAAYYQWINQQRLPGSDQSALVVWFEGHNQALAIGPSLPRNTKSDSEIDLARLVSLAVG